MYDSQHDVYVGRQLEKLQDCYKQELAENYSDVAKLELEELSLQNHGYCEMNTKKNNSDKEKLITKSLQSCYPPKKKRNKKKKKRRKRRKTMMKKKKN